MTKVGSINFGRTNLNKASTARQDLSSSGPLARFFNSAITSFSDAVSISILNSFFNKSRMVIFLKGGRFQIPFQTRRLSVALNKARARCANTNPYQERLNEF